MKLKSVKYYKIYKDAFCVDVDFSHLYLAVVNEKYIFKHDGQNWNYYRLLESSKALISEYAHKIGKLEMIINTKEFTKTTLKRMSKEDLLFYDVVSTKLTKTLTMWLIILGSLGLLLSLIKACNVI